MSSGEQSGGIASNAPPAYFAWRAVRHFRGWGLVVAAVGLLLTFVVAQLVPPVYRSETVLIMNAFPGSPVSREAGARLQEMLYSAERLAKIAEQLRLYPGARNTPDKVEAFKRNIEFKIHPGSTFSLAFLGGTPEEVQKVTAQLAASLIADDTRMRALEARRSNTFLEGEKKRIEDEVKRREGELQAFLRENPEVAMQPEIELITPGGDTVALEREIERLRQAQERTLSGGAAAFADVELVAARRQAESELSEARQDLADKRSRLTDQHPDVMVATQRMARAEKALQRARQAESASVRSGGGDAGESARITKQVELLERKLASARANTRSTRRGTNRKIAALQVQYQSMRHIIDDGRARLSRLEEQQFQAQMLEKAQAEEGLQLLSVLDPAFRPAAPAARRRLKVVVGGLFLSVLLGAAVAFIRAWLSDRVFEAADAEKLAGAVVLASVPATRGRV